MKYYHITALNNVQSILKNGLRCNSDGQIFVFENKSIRINDVNNTVADIIANNQIFLDKYVMFEIDDKGFNTDLINDNVGELSSKRQWFVEQSVIDKKYLNVFGIFKTNYKNFFNLT
jgi:hypothetical protein